MTSPRQSPARPIESVELRISFRADRETSKMIKEAIPYARAKGGVVEVKIRAREPSEVAEKAKEVLDRLRAVEKR